MTIDLPRHTQIPQLRALWKEAFGDSDAYLDLFFNTAFSPSRCLCITEGDEVTAALYWFDCSFDGHPLAYVYAVATAQSRRGQGLCRALMTHTHRHLKQNGYLGVILVPGSDSLFSLYGKMGYSICSSVGELTCRAAEPAAALYELSVEEYAQRRRTLLPQGGVVQEGENLRFLATQFSFWGSSSFVLAARIEGEQLFCAELLGDLTQAPAILTALGCTQGHFRTVGQTRPFAMYLSLSDPPTQPPCYFGFAFD